MREIKFRAWDASNHTEKMRIGKREIYDDMLGFRFQHFDCDSSDVVFEQYIGIKDKHGREIYEGDIVSFGVRANGPACPSFHVPRGVVSYDIAGNLAFGTWGSEWCYGVSVIGNIHENPELVP